MSIALPGIRGELTQEGPDTHDPSYNSSPIDACGIPVSRRFVAAVHIALVKLCSSDEEVVPNQDSSHSGKEDRPAREDGDKRRSIVDIVPWAHSDGNDGEDKASPTNIDPSRAQSCHVHAS